MTSTATLSSYEIRAEGWRASTERLGVSGTIRFLMEYDPGHCDYVEERRGLLRELTLDEALERARVAVSVRGSAVRVSPHLYNDAGDVEALRKVLVDAVAAS